MNALSQTRLQEVLQEHSRRCIDCKLCVTECTFLSTYGTPGQIARGYQVDNRAMQQMAYGCSLCGLCGAVCPAHVGLDPQTLFLEMRRYAVEGGGAFPGHSKGLRYEKFGVSKLAQLYGLPEGCHTVLFPGCAMAGSRSHIVEKLFHHLQRTLPQLGVVLDCCTKISHDIGRQTYSAAQFAEMRTRLLDLGVKTVLVSCPSCYQMFHQYGAPLKVKTVYEQLCEHDLPVQEGKNLSEQVTIHDSCASRMDTTVHGAVRSLVTRLGYGHIIEMKHSGTTTYCCGEGGSVASVAPLLSAEWVKRRHKESRETPVVCYCAGCTQFLGSEMQVYHILDMLFEQDDVRKGKPRVTSPPLTYVKRLLLKRRLKKQLPEVRAGSGKKSFK